MSLGSLVIRLMTVKSSIIDTHGSRKDDPTEHSWPRLSDQASALPWTFPKQARRETGQEMFTVLELKGLDETSQALGGH